MSGIYIHIPFCKQACHYCDFHFSTVMGKKKAMVLALCEELRLRKDEFEKETIETIYFGGGTPSVLDLKEIKKILAAVYENYRVTDNPEITLEANPDDLVSAARNTSDAERSTLTERSRSEYVTDSQRENTKSSGIAEDSQSPLTERSRSETTMKDQNNQIFENYKKAGINRLSIGIQSFYEEDLILMNRAHNAKEAEACIELATQYFDNISIDLIYGMPNMTNERWKKNITKAISLNIPHISSYALTVEPNTALARFVKKGVVKPVDDEVAQEHFNILNDTLTKAGYSCYEISNFGKPGYFSKNNSGYWQQKKYLGIGPSAHSFDGEGRAWNINNNPKYLKAIGKGELPITREMLSKTDKYNEYIMTGLRTIWGVSLSKVKSDYGEKYKDYLLQQAEKFIEEHLLFLDGDVLLTTKKGKFLADGIAADLFMVKMN